MKKEERSIYSDAAMYKYLPRKIRENKKKKKLRELVSYARKNSPFYAELYKDVKEDFELADLPAISKEDVKAHFSEFSTDRELTRECVDAFMSDGANNGKKLLGKYYISTTSGTSGLPVVLAKDGQTVTAEVAICDMYIEKFQKKLAVLCGMGSFYGIATACAASEDALKNSEEWFRYFDLGLPAEEICAALNEYQPKVLRGFSSYFDILADYQRQGMLDIHPAYVCGVGEAMMESTKHNVEKYLGCKAYEAYGCTEMGLFASSVGCTEGHLHMCDPFTIVEAVDADGVPVPDGTISDSVLITHLGNRVQPLIRYKVDDRIVIHNEKCSCGNKMPWIECEGRYRDTPRFYKNGQLVPIFTSDLLNIPDDYYPSIQCNDFAITIYNNRRLELKYRMHDGTDKHELFEKLKADYLEVLKDFDDIEVTLSEEEPESRDIAKKRKLITVIND